MVRFKRQYQTSFLFPKLSFLSGMGSVFNLAGNYYNFNYSDTPAEADSKALENDWGVIGEDLSETMERNPVNSFQKTPPL
jgi:hypothetical protein